MYVIVFGNIRTEGHLHLHTTTRVFIFFVLTDIVIKEQIAYTFLETKVVQRCRNIGAMLFHKRQHERVYAQNDASAVAVLCMFFF